MAAEKKVCAYCGKGIGIYEAELKDDQHYHPECIKSIELDEQLERLEKRYPTTERKLTRIIAQNLDIEDYAKKSAQSLNTIKNIILVLVLLGIIGAIFQACSVMR